MKFKSLHDFGKHIIPDEKLFDIFTWIYQPVDKFEKSDLDTSQLHVEVVSIRDDIVTCNMSVKYTSALFSFPFYILECDSDFEMYVKLKGWLNERIDS